ncbi:MAG: biopolymer transporter ExbD, partial [Actinomycetota bacterium]
GVYTQKFTNTEYGNIIDVVNATRKVQGDRIRFIVSPTDRTDNPKDVLEAKVPAPPKDEGKIARPNPLTLVVELTADGRIKLNNEGHDSLESVAAKLKEVFKFREDSGIWREGTNEVEATVFIKAPRSIKYGEVIKALDALKGSGANPVGLQIDDLPQYKIQ